MYPHERSLVEKNKKKPFALIGVNSDSAAVTEPHLFLTCLREGFEEVLDLGGDHGGVSTPAAPPPPASGSTHP